MQDDARVIMQRIDALASISEDPHQLTRTFASSAMRRANDLVAEWMREAGMSVRTDAIGNLIGSFESNHSGAKTLLFGSHLDTVRNAGRFDGPLGVILAIACVAELHRTGIHLPFAIEVIGFCDEEGVRYQSTYLGSRVLAGCFDPSNLARLDSSGISMTDAIREFGGNPDEINNARRDPADLLGFVEVHIEQGPVLERMNQAVGIVSAIAGQTRAKLTFIGNAGHAGTTPMTLRSDALCAAAEFIMAVEKLARETAELVATIGQIQNEPNASNVIPGLVSLTLDVRHQLDTVRRKAAARMEEMKIAIERKRGVQSTWQIVQETDSVECDHRLSSLLKIATEAYQPTVTTLPSGAGHDTAVMAQITPAAMLFVRCARGLSHHPDELATTADIAIAFRVMNRFLHLLAQQQQP